MNNEERARSFEEIQRQNRRLREEYKKQEELKQLLREQAEEEGEKKRKEEHKKKARRRQIRKYGLFGWKRWWKVSVLAFVVAGMALTVHFIQSYQQLKPVETAPVIDIIGMKEEIQLALNEADKQKEQERLEEMVKETILARQEEISECDWITLDFLDVNEYSRPGALLEKVNGIVIHYVANPQTTAAQNRSYFQNLANPDANPSKEKKSSHFIVGLDGEIIQCVPISEIAYASNERNVDTISIENCHMDVTGRFNTKTYESLVRLTAWLCEEFDLGSENIIRHYDVTGKLCPIYFVQHPEEWQRFLDDVDAYRNHFLAEMK